MHNSPYIANMIAFASFIFAGIINGSFPLFVKHMDKWKFENIWLQFAIWTFLIVPWFFAIILVPQIFTVYAHIPIGLLLMMVIFGFLFGAGQVCFMFAMSMIGIGLAFVINIGLGVAIGITRAQFGILVAVVEDETVFAQLAAEYHTVAHVDGSCCTTAIENWEGEGEFMLINQGQHGAG